MHVTKFLLFCLGMMVGLHSDPFYEDCKSIEEVISKETEIIISTPPADHDALATLYVSRGESYLLSAEYEKALRDFETALLHLYYSTDQDSRFAIAFRAMFGEVFSYDHLGMQEHAEYAIQQLWNITKRFTCDDCSHGQRCSEAVTLTISRINGDSNYFIIPIFVDPNERQSAEWCEQTVKNTGGALRGIAINIRISSIKAAALELIKALEKQAIKCCYAGGLWSACVKPLANKFEQWNRKWKVFGIPPDPAWDSDLQ